MTIKTTLLAIGATTLITGACIAGILNGRDSATEAAHSTPVPLPTATITTQLPQATITLPPKVITKYLPQATKTITKTAPAPQVLQCPGRSEDSCYPDYIGKGRWVIRQGERPMPKATTSKKVPQASKKVPGATIPGVCRHPSITRGMLHDCIALAGRAKVVAPGKYEIPAGKVLIKECTDQYTGTELGDCLKQ